MYLFREQLLGNRNATLFYEYLVLFSLFLTFPVVVLYHQSFFSPRMLVILLFTALFSHWALDVLSFYGLFFFPFLLCYHHIIFSVHLFSVSSSRLFFHLSSVLSLLFIPSVFCIISASITPHDTPAFSPVVL